jgi:S1-C subfamily serine protease
LVAQLQPGGPAERAGLRGPRITRRGTSLLGVTRIDYSAADIVLAVDGEEVKSQDDFLNAIERKRPNDQVELTVLRDGKRINLSVTLGGPNLSRS